MLCPKCGAENLPDSKFCKNCGTLVKNVTDNQKCSYCGGINAEQAEFCEYCGKNLIKKKENNTQSVPIYSNNRNVKNKEDGNVNKKWIAVIGLVLVTTAICVGVVIINNRKPAEVAYENSSYDYSNYNQDNYSQNNDDNQNNYSQNNDDIQEDDYVYEDGVEDNSLAENYDNNENSESENTDYIIADSNSRYLTDSDVSGLSLQELNYAKNEIYARHGRKFDSRELDNYFSSKSWYDGIYESDDFDANYSGNVLNDYEKKNTEFLSEKEHKIDSEGYQLDAN